MSKVIIEKKKKIYILKRRRTFTICMVTTNYLQHDTSWYYVANIEKITLGGSP